MPLLGAAALTRCNCVTLCLTPQTVRKEFHGGGSATDKDSFLIKKINKQRRKMICQHIIDITLFSTTPSPPFVSLRFLSYVVSKVSDGELLTN